MRNDVITNFTNFNELYNRGERTELLSTMVVNEPATAETHSWHRCGLGIVMSQVRFGFAFCTVYLLMEFSPVSNASWYMTLIPSLAWHAVDSWIFLFAMERNLTCPKIYNYLYSLLLYSHLHFIEVLWQHLSIWTWIYVHSIIANKLIVLKTVDVTKEKGKDQRCKHKPLKSVQLQINDWKRQSTNRIIACRRKVANCRTCSRTFDPVMQHNHFN
jgi:hypothetical protein